jgi:hypothetical protein
MCNTGYEILKDSKGAGKRAPENNPFLVFLYLAPHCGTLEPPSGDALKRIARRGLYSSSAANCAPIACPQIFTAGLRSKLRTFCAFDLSRSPHDLELGTVRKAVGTVLLVSNSDRGSKPKIAHNAETVRNSIYVTVTTIVGLGQADLMAQCTLTVTYIFKDKVQLFVHQRRTFAVTFSVMRGHLGMVLSR